MRRGLAGEERAQAVVEMAVVAPVMIVLALVVYNLMTFSAAVARFDRIAPDVVIAQAVSPAAGDDAVANVQAGLEESMDGYDVEIEVSCAPADARGADALVTLAAGCATYSCTMRYVPVPSSIGIAGVQVATPARLSHTREIVVDPWRSGVVA